MAPRSYPVPVGARRGPLLASANASFDQLDVAAAMGNTWAAKVVTNENTRLLDEICGGNPRVPAGVLADGSTDEIVALTLNGRVWRGHWETLDAPQRSVPLEPNEAGFVARALADGADLVVMRPHIPAAFINSLIAAAVEIPEGASVVAVVDETDRNAVMDLIAVSPGPVTLRRHDGAWVDDPGWVSILRGVKPPPIVKLETAQIDSVAAQVDEQTEGDPFKETKPGAVRSSGEARADDMLVAWALSAAGNATGCCDDRSFLVAVSGPADKAASKLTPGGTMPKDLRQYWAFGPGAAKIRWGTKGAWTRCHRYLTKYIGPFRSKGACTNLGKLRGGHGVATHVG